MGRARQIQGQVNWRVAGIFFRLAIIDLSDLYSGLHKRPSILGTFDVCRSYAVGQVAAQ